MYKDPPVRTNNTSHKSLSVHCASSPECNIKVLITGTCKRGTLDMCVVCIMELFYQHIPLTFTSILTSLYNVLINPSDWVVGGGLMKVSYRVLVWIQWTLTFHVETRHQNILHSMIFQYTSMTNDTLPHTR